MGVSIVLDQCQIQVRQDLHGELFQHTVLVWMPPHSQVSESLFLLGMGQLARLCNAFSDTLLDLSHAEAFCWHIRHNVLQPSLQCTARPL